MTTAASPQPIFPSTIEEAHQRIQELELTLAQTATQAATVELRLKQLLNHLLEGVVLTDENGIIVLINEQFCQLWKLERKPQEWLGRSWKELAAINRLATLDPIRFDEQLQERRQQGQAVFNEPIMLRDGRVFERDFVPVQTPGKPVNLLLRMRDATEYHRVTEQLKAVASIPGQNPNPILRISVAGERLYSNAAALALCTALTPSEKQQLWGELQVLAAATLQQGAPRQEDIQAGSECYAAFVVPFSAEGYANLYLVNITKRILTERELQRAKEEAEGAVRARENFLANMSHEIRTPMNGVLGMATQLGKTRLDGRQQEFLRIIRTSGQHLLTIINDVLDMAKITSGKLEFEQTAFNLCDSMAEALQPLVVQAVEKGLAFTGVPLRNSCPLPWVIGDPHRLNQVLINLVANAVKFTEPGGQITVIGEQLEATPETLTVRFSVTDTGIGIPAEQQARIFEGFTQAYADTTRRFGGTGLGLSISRSIIEQLEGTLHVESQVGQGSTFAFELTLPRAAALTAHEAASAFDTGALRGRRVLLVEDNEINRDVARMLLEEWGVEVTEAENGPLGLELYQQHDYDIILMDIQMPGMSGLEATAIIRKLPDPKKANVPVLALTANAFRADNIRYMEAGMDACLTKPFDEADLYEHIERLIMTSAASREASYDLTRLHALSHGRAAFVTKIIRSFLTNMPASLEKLAAAATTHDWEQVAALVHHIKPGLESLGVRHVADAVRRLEQHEPETAPQLLHDAVKQLLSQVRRALSELPQELPEGV